MNKLKHICILSLSGIILLNACMALTSCTRETPEQWVKQKFNVSLPFDITPDNIIKQDRRLFIAIQLTSIQTQKILNKDFKQDGFLGWEQNDRNIDLGIDEKRYFIDEKDQLLVNYKQGYSNPYNFIAMFLDTRKHILIFCWGITYGR